MDVLFALSALCRMSSAVVLHFVSGIDVCVCQTSGIVEIYLFRTGAYIQYTCIHIIVHGWQNKLVVVVDFSIFVKRNNFPQTSCAMLSTYQIAI